MAYQQPVTAVLTTVGTTCSPDLGRVSVGVYIAAGPKALLDRNFDATVDAWKARELAMKLLDAADKAEYAVRRYGWIPRRGEFDRIAMGM